MGGVGGGGGGRRGRGRGAGGWGDVVVGVGRGAQVGRAIMEQAREFSKVSATNTLPHTHIINTHAHTQTGA